MSRLVAPIAALLLAAPSSALAYSSGKTGNSTSGCGSCHGSSADSGVSVSISPSSTTVAPGATITVTLELTSSDSSHTGAGLNLSATDGTLTAGSNTRVQGGEITHSSTESADSSGTVSFDFEWTAPSTEDIYTLYAAGNAVNANKGKDGDGWNTVGLDIEVMATGTDADGDGFDDTEDCDDSDPDVFPGAIEVCNDIDDDCDGVADNGLVFYDYWPDDDGDGYGDADADPISSCEEEISGYALDDSDCDDDDPDAWEEEDCLDDTGDDGGDDSGDDGGGGSGGDDAGDDGGDDAGDDGGDDAGDDDGGEDHDDHDHDHDDHDDEDTDAKEGCSTVGAAPGSVLALLGLVGLARRRES